MEDALDFIGQPQDLAPTGHPRMNRTRTSVPLNQETGSNHSRLGDRGQEIVFIGQQMDEAAMRSRLDACPLDERLASAESNAWAEFGNPIPEPAVAEESA